MAHADDAQTLEVADTSEQLTDTATATSSDGKELRWSFLYDGGALAFFWLPLAGKTALNKWVQPPSTPRLFSPKEGGAPSSRSTELPSWQVTAGALVLTSYIAFADNHESHWYHAKGMAESLITASLITAVGKVTFGRHRPDYEPDSDDPSSRRSFPSGHSTNALSAATYFALYLRYHGFDRFRPSGTLPWWEGLTYGALATAAVYVPYTRVRDNRHNLSDVATGALIGASTSALFFYWQESRYRRIAGNKEVALEHPVLRPVLMPDLQARALWLSMKF